ncbi:DUF3575 domain-containing protein [Mangrovibacterium diazotrophicum]|uniref:Uncharacterized protein DUF3575 n=1 Tax=Mangrovibacterium diazotrophicum TaxID=1261403 RepID=A0A419VV23_9BACT|nr:DUF3575 domain-containing protein [Mangrovibacterium diazotrophicum]RKD85988.1 uncharacterized protein DUF3575 [Mangrovibacterium diazotrophicum]
MKTKTVNRKCFIFLFLLLTLVAVSFSLSAQNISETAKGDTIRKEKTFKQSINLCPIAPAFGIFSINYERLLTNHHGLMIRADYESVPNNYSEANINVSGKAAILNYRYHVKGGLQSCFIGAFSRYRIYNGDGNLNETDFDFKLSEVTIGLNAGKRWILKNGLNLNMALGYGVFMDHLNTKNTSPDVLESISQFQKEYDLYNGFFGELSIGYAF